MPDGYDRDRDDFNNNDRGKIFEHGADRFFHDSENGYAPDSRKFVAGGERIIFDKVKYEGERTYTIEEKSGRIQGLKDEKQLKVVRALLEQNTIHHHELRSVEGEMISDAAREKIDALKRDFPDRFTHQVIPRADAREIWARGLQRERGEQLELPQVRDTARQHRDQARANTRELGPDTGRDTRAHTNEPRAPERSPEPDHIPTLSEELRERIQQSRTLSMAAALERGNNLDAVRQAVREDITVQAEIVTAAREQGLEFDYEAIRTAHAELTAALEYVRERERQNSRDMMAAAGRTPEQIELLVPMLEENRDARRRDLTAHLTTIEHEVRRQDWRREVAPHNEIAQQMGIEHVRQAEQQPRGYPIEHRSRVSTAQRDAERLIFTPEQVAELDIEKYRAVRDGERLGYDPAEKVHIYQRGEEPPVKVAHEDRERRLAEIAKNVREGLSVDEVIARNRDDLTFSTPIEEARLAPLAKEPPALTMSRDHGQELDRGLSRDR